MSFVGALDQGTSSTRFMIFDNSGSVVGAHQLEHRQILPRPGWVEHDAAEIWERTQEVIAVALRNAGISGRELAAIGITNQRETTVIWDKKTGKPLHNAIVWQDTRTQDFLDRLSDSEKALIIKKTGLAIAPYFSGSKLNWLIKNVSEVKRAIEAGTALAGTIDSWLLWNITGGVHRMTNF
jgi:glycerol kinase